MVKVSFNIKKFYIGVNITQLRVELCVIPCICVTFTKEITTKEIKVRMPILNEPDNYATHYPPMPQPEDFSLEPSPELTITVTGSIGDINKLKEKLKNTKKRASK